MLLRGKSQSPQATHCTAPSQILPETTNTDCPREVRRGGLQGGYLPQLCPVGTQVMVHRLLFLPRDRSLEFSQSKDLLRPAALSPEAPAVLPHLNCWGCGPPLPSWEQTDGGGQEDQAPGRCRAAPHHKVWGIPPPGSSAVDGPQTFPVPQSSLHRRGRGLPAGQAPERVCSPQKPPQVPGPPHARPGRELGRSRGARPVPACANSGGKPGPLGRPPGFLGSHHISLQKKSSRQPTTQTLCPRASQQLHRPLRANPLPSSTPLLPGHPDPGGEPLSWHRPPQRVMGSNRPDPRGAGLAAQGLDILPSRPARPQNCQSVQNAQNKGCGWPGTGEGGHPLSLFTCKMGTRWAA